MYGVYNMNEQLMLTGLKMAQDENTKWQKIVAIIGAITLAILLGLIIFFIVKYPIIARGFNHWVGC